MYDLFFKPALGELISNIYMFFLIYSEVVSMYSVVYVMSLQHILNAYDENDGYMDTAVFSAMSRDVTFVCGTTLPLVPDPMIPSQLNLARKTTQLCGVFNTPL